MVGPERTDGDATRTGRPGGQRTPGRRPRRAGRCITAAVERVRERQGNVSPHDSESVMNLAVLLSFASALLAPSLAVPPTLNGMVGPDFNIALTRGGKAVHQLKAGTYRIKVVDKSDIHNFHLMGPGVNKRTSVAGKGTVTWTVALKRGKYTFQCDPHAGMMNGHLTVTK
jgi:plastocyanin